MPHHSHGHGGNHYHPGNVQVHRGSNYHYHPDIYWGMGWTPWYYNATPCHHNSAVVVYDNDCGNTCFGAHLAGIILIGASVVFLAVFVLPVVAKVLLALALILGAALIASAVFSAAKNSTFFGCCDNSTKSVGHGTAPVNSL